MEDAIIVGVTMVLVEGIKRAAKRIGVRDEAVTQIVTPLAVLGFAGALNVAAAAIWAPELFWREALKEGLTLGAVAGGVYGLGKAALGQS